MLLRVSFNFVVVDNVFKNFDVLIEVWLGSGNLKLIEILILVFWNNGVINMC